MATPKKTYPYAIIYRDGTFMVYDLTKDDFEAVTKAMFGEKKVAITTVGILDLSDVRGVIEQKIKPVEKTKATEGDPSLSIEEQAWLNHQREHQTDEEDYH